MERGWYATGRLTPLYAKVGGRDRLAELADVSAQTLSAYNSGSRRLGETNAGKIARAASVTLRELGQPAPQLPDAEVAQLVADQLARQAALLESLSATAQQIAAAVKELRQLSRDLSSLEPRPPARRRRG